MTNWFLTSKSLNHHFPHNVPTFFSNVPTFSRALGHCPQLWNFSAEHCSMKWACPIQPFFYSRKFRSIFMPPNFREVEGGILVWACLSVGLSITLWQLRNSWGAYSRILKLYVSWTWKISIPVLFFFFSTGLVVLELCPFFDYVWTALWTEYLKNC